MFRSTSLSCLLGVLALGCGDSTSEDGTTVGGSSTGPSGTTSEGTTSVATTGVDTTAASEESGDDGPGPMCLLEEDDCVDPDQKCMPYSEEPDRIPDEARCCPLRENPDLEGERCTVDEYDGSCRDSCEAGTMCLIDDIETLEGTCRAFCDPDSPGCDDGQGTCKSFFELIPGAFTVPLCMDRCDPLLQDCSPSSWHCIPDTPTQSGQSGFICVPPPPDEALGQFDPCGLANDCEKGLACIFGGSVPSCEGEFACCTAYCSLSDGDAPCQAIDPAMVCVDWMSPDPDWTDVGVCGLPP